MPAGSAVAEASQGKGRGMKRRDFVRALVAASVTCKSLLGGHAAAQVAGQAAGQVTPAVPPAAPPQTPTAPGPVPWMRGLEEARPLAVNAIVPDAVAETNTHFFNDRQMATLRRLSEVLMPPWKKYPGAIEAGAPEFLDFLIGTSPADRQQTYRAGLDRLDADARKSGAASFAAASAEQADAVIRPGLRVWMNDHAPSEPFAYFINTVHSDIRTATVNSQAWSEAAALDGQESEKGLYWFPVDPDLHRENSAAAGRGSGQRHA